MKTLKMLAIAMFFAILGTSFIEAKKGCASGWKAKRKAPGVYICVRKKGSDMCANGMHTKDGICVLGCKKGEHKDKKNKAKCNKNGKKPSKAKVTTVGPTAPSTLSNSEFTGMPVIFYDIKDGKVMASDLKDSNIAGGPADTGIYTLNKDMVNIPTGATHVVVGPDTADTDTVGTVELAGLVATGKAYVITTSADWELVVKEVVPAVAAA